MENKQQELDNAQKLINKYGQVLSQLDASSYGHPQSLLPCDKDKLKSALLLLLWEVNQNDKAINDSLVQAYTFIGQFIDDDSAKIVANSQAVMQSSDMGHEDWGSVETATRIVNQIKLEMEELLKDVQAFI